MERKKITFDSFIRGVISLVLIVAGLALLKHLSGVLLPFFIAWLLLCGKIFPVPTIAA